MEKRWKRYLLFHLDCLALAVGFAFYTRLMGRLFPDGHFHCVLHDLLHLYCPFCGGTRTFFALLRFDFPKALRSNPAVLLAGAVALAADIRALVMLIRRKEGELLPRVLLRAAVWYFALWTALVNVLMLAGVDPLGDLAAYWHLPAWRFRLFVPLAFFLAVFTSAALSDYSIFARLRAACAFAALFCLVAVAAVLWGQWWIALFCIPVCAGLILWIVLRKKKTAKETKT